MELRWYKPVILAFTELRQEDGSELKVWLGYCFWTTYIVRLSQTTTITNSTTKQQNQKQKLNTFNSHIQVLRYLNCKLVHFHLASIFKI